MSMPSLMGKQAIRVQDSLSLGGTMGAVKASNLGQLLNRNQTQKDLRQAGIKN